VSSNLPVQPTRREGGGLLGTPSTRVARRLLLVFLLLGVGPAMVTLGLTHMRSREALRESHLVSLAESVDSLMSVLSGRLEVADQVATALLDHEPARQLVAASRGRFDAAVLIEPDRAPRWLQPDAPRAPPPAGLVDALPTRTDRSTLAITRSGTQTPSLWLLRPLPAQAGAIALRLAPAAFWPDAGGLPAEARLCVLDADSQPLACEAPPPPEVLARFARARAGAINGHLDWEDTEPMTAVYREMFLKARFGAAGWSVVLIQPSRLGLAAQRRLTEAVWPAAIVALMSALLLAIGAVRRTLGPLRTLTEATERLGDGNFSGRIAVRSDNEFAVLGVAFNRMADGLARQFDALDALARIDRLILENRPMAEIGGVASDLLARSLPGAATVVALDEAGERRWQLYRSQENGRQPREIETPDAGWCETVRAAGAKHVQSRDEGSMPAGLHPLGTGACLLLPVIADDGMLAGCITVAWRPARPPTATESELIAGFAGRIAVAIAAMWRTRLLHQRANFDSLTGLPNRPHFLEQLAAQLAAARTGGRVDVLFVDLDGFSHINDSLGHAAGDRMLGEVGQRLRDTLGDRGMVARLGGDEFALALTETASSTPARAQAQRVIEALARPFLLAEGPQFIGASVGIASFPEHGEDAATLLRHADMAMYRAKAGGRGAMAVYEASMQEAAIERARLEAELRLALKRNEFELHYEPLVEAGSGRVAGCEALVRWRHPQRGLIGPAVFIPVAEETGLISALGSWVLGEACRQYMQWQRDGVPVGFVSVNASVRQFQRPDFVDEVARTLREHGMSGDALKLELTESLLMDEPREVERRLHMLAALGVSLALDDFGTGYSSLTYLKRLPMHTIKLDRSFVRDLVEREEARELVRSAIAMIHALRKQVVVEGVEMMAQRELLTRWGADLLQGWLFSQSLPAQAFADYVRRAPVAPVAGFVAGPGLGPDPVTGATPPREAATLLRPTTGSVGLTGQTEALEQPMELFRP
jgi:diguanylate cyclase (GGDEF)-like protein